MTERSNSQQSVTQDSG